jgi:hypothetical protein
LCFSFKVPNVVPCPLSLWCMPLALCVRWYSPPLSYLHVKELGASSFFNLGKVFLKNNFIF